MASLLMIGQIFVRQCVKKVSYLCWESIGWKFGGLWMAPYHSQEDTILWGMEMRNPLAHGVVSENVCLLNRISAIRVIRITLESLRREELFDLETVKRPKKSCCEQMNAYVCSQNLNRAYNWTKRDNEWLLIAINTMLISIAGISIFRSITSPVSLHGLKTPRKLCKSDIRFLTSIYWT